jgi:uncharacterized protein
MKLPSTQQIESLHKKYAPTPKILQLVLTHCRIVNDVAQQLILKNALAVDARLVEVGCLLHDIGVYPLFDENGRQRENLHYITHGVRGEAILKQEGFSEAIWRFASHRTGVGLTSFDISNQKLPLPAEDYEAETPEEALIMYADKFHSKTEPPYFNSYQWYTKYVAKFGHDKAEKFEHMAQEFGIPDLSSLIEKYGYELRD